MLTRRPPYCIMICRQLKSLIKSGGGTGPVKPGNLHQQGAKSGGVNSEDEDIRSESQPAGTARRAFLNGRAELA